MIFAGWVPIRRAILEHTMDGRLNITEYAVFNVLALLADRHTGSGRINAPALRTYLPGLKYEMAKRTLTSLQKKGYIWRSIKPRSTAVYLYWINHYEITDGPHKMFQTNLSKVFATGDITAITYDRHVPESTLQNTPEDTPQRPHYNDKDNDNRQKQTSVLDIEKGSPERLRETGSSSVSTGAQNCQSESACEHAGSHEASGSFVLQSVTKCADTPPEQALEPPKPDIRWMGVNQGFRDRYGQPIYFEAANDRMAALNLVWDRGEFFRRNDGIAVPRECAYQFINEGRIAA